MRKNSAGGKGWGKKGDSVFVINHGVQIEREYNSKVSNPSTPAQVGQRARFKLASQVSAALENVIAIPRKGILSPRNRFVKRNMPFFYGNTQGAFVSYENLQLTLSSNGIPSISVSRAQGGMLDLTLTDSVVKSFSHVAYCVFRKTDEQLLQLMDSTIVQVTEDNPDGWVTIDEPSGDLVVYAYGYRLKNARAKAKYENYRVANATDVASLIANRVIELSDINFSATRGASLQETQQENVQPSGSTALLYLTIWGGGSIELKVNGNVESWTPGQAKQLPLGGLISLTATPSNGYIFNCWKQNGSQEVFEMNQTIEFTMVGMMDLIASFIVPDHGLE